MSVSPGSSIAAGNKFGAGLSEFIKALSRFCSHLLLLLIGAYRTIGTTHFGGQCRFQPSCSEYAMEAVRLHSPFSAVRLIALRILRCRPGGDFGLDPVPNENQQTQKCNSRCVCASGNSL